MLVAILEEMIILDTIVWVALITASTTHLSPQFPKWLSVRDEKRKIKRDEEQQLLTAHRIAYHKFIQVFSTKYLEDSEKYLKAAPDAAEF